MKEGLTFKNLSGRNLSGHIEFWYAENARDGGQYVLFKEVPPEIVLQGEGAIFAYAEDKINCLKENIRRNETIEDEIRRNHIPLHAIYEDGTRLEGRIVEATSRYIMVELDKPIQGQSCINYGYACALAGKSVFDAEHQLSQDGLESAKTALGWAYEKAGCEQEQKMCERLNIRSRKECDSHQ